MYRMKKTKIVATMSDFRCTEEFVKQLFDAGMDVVRVNSAHVSEDGATHIVETVHRVNPAIPIMIDTKGPEIRVTTIADEYGNSINFRPGDRVAVRGSDGSDFTTRKVVYMNVPSIVSDIPVGARMLIADGELEIRVVGKNDTELDCEFVVGGAMRSRKSVNVPSVSINLPSVTEKDRRFIEWAVKNDVDFIAASFVRCKEDVIALRKFVDYHGARDLRIIAKIENIEGVNNFDEILRYADGIMVARGDMGVEIPFERLPGIQKHFIRSCCQAGKTVITATQMLESMISHANPTRAEITDVANAVFDGTSAVMLSGETAMGKYPALAVEVMGRIVTQAENDAFEMDAYAGISYEIDNNDTTNAVCDATCTTARDISAKAIIAVTKSGQTARRMSKFRPVQPIVAATPVEKTFHQLALSGGVFPVLARLQSSSDELLLHAIDCAKQIDAVENGDIVVIAAGIPLDTTGSTNLMRVAVVGKR